MDNVYRDDLPPIPSRMSRLPVERGYPVPWFVEFVDGHYDFRIQSYRKRFIAIKEHLCWLCGQPLGKYLAFVIGPMCAINRTSSEPPSHRECAEFAVKACPFLILKEPERRESGLPDDTVSIPGGLRRNPGGALIWITTNYKVFPIDNDYLVRVGEPIETLWFRKGRAATRAEILESIESGCPVVREAAESEGPQAVEMFERMKASAMELLPAASKTVPVGF